jgi:hypothetical protein
MVAEVEFAAVELDEVGVEKMSWHNVVVVAAVSVALVDFGIGSVQAELGAAVVVE